MKFAQQKLNAALRSSRQAKSCAPSDLLEKIAAVQGFWGGRVDRAKCRGQIVKMSLEHGRTWRVARISGAFWRTVRFPKASTAD